jgi:hypothetical protein
MDGFTAIAGWTLLRRALCLTSAFGVKVAVLDVKSTRKEQRLRNSLLMLTKRWSPAKYNELVNGK